MALSFDYNARTSSTEFTLKANDATSFKETWAAILETLLPVPNSYTSDTFTFPYSPGNISMVYTWTGSSHITRTTVTNSAPTFTSITPAYYTNTGTQAVTIVGTNFLVTPTVTIGGVALTSVTRVSATQLTATVPTSINAGACDVVITNPDARSVTGSSAFTSYANPAPTITSITPGTGANTGTTAVSIVGTGFLASPTVQLLTTPATSLTSVVRVSATSITAVVPSGITQGTYDLKVTNTDTRSATKTAAFIVT